jgi:hypothetical protein
MPTSLANAASVGMDGGRRHRGASVKTLKRMLKKAGLKTTGRKAALTRRAKKAHLKMHGGVDGEVKENEGVAPMGGRRRRGSRRMRGGVCPHGMVDYKDGNGCVPQ